MISACAFSPDRSLIKSTKTVYVMFMRGISVCQMPTSGPDNIIGKLKREPVANGTSDAVIGKVKYRKALFRFFVQIGG